MTKRRTKVITSPEPEGVIEEILHENTEPVEPPPSPVRQLTLLTRQIYPYLGKDVVVMLDDAGTEYLVDASLVDFKVATPQAVDTSLAMLPYLWQEELEALVPDLETLYRNFRRSFLRAGAFDRSALETRVRNNMFDTAYPYKQQFFAGE